MASSGLLKAFQHFSPVIKNRSRFLITPVCSVKTSLEARLGLPPKPKKPINGFMKFLQNTRETLRVTEPDIGPQELIKRSSELWKDLDPSVKISLENQYKAELENYNKLINNYEASLTPEQKADKEQVLIEMKAAKQKKKDKLERNRKLRELERPKKPTNAFMNYLEKNELKNLKRTSAYVAEMSKKWNELPQTEKQVFIVDYELNMKRYEVELLSWEKKMINEGHLDLVRQKTLATLNKDLKKEEKSPKKSKKESQKKE